ncbi:MAG: ribonuclease PH [Planctomycetota bacterium]|nr:ribonuclease PH [Planctomycetota bacterium]
MTIPRDFNRGPDDLRPINIQRQFTPAAGSILYSCGDTKVLCTAVVEENVPKWMVGRGKGWVTATYEMLPASTGSRKAPGKPDGRATEIKRLIGRSLRAAIDMEALGERAVHIDCHVLNANAGTRTACINAGYLALCDAISGLIAAGLLEKSPIKHSIEAISVGLIEGEGRLDLYYKEDSAADVDFNVVSANGVDLVEVQGTAEGEPFSRAQLDSLLDLAFVGLKRLKTLHQEALESRP